MDRIKLGIVYGMRALLHVFYLFPVKKNRIIFMSQLGKFYSCNPRYLYEYLHQEYGDKLDYVWIFQEDRKLAEPETKTVRPGSLKYYYYMMTSRFIINNTGISSLIPKRKSQYYINTWHGGGAYKKSCMDVKTSLYQKKIFALTARETDVFLSTCAAATEAMSGATGVAKKKFMKSGYPRNDMMFGNTEEIRKKIHAYYQIPEDTRIVLYAPTYRGAMEDDNGSFDSEIDAKRCLAALEKRYPGEHWVFAYRMHIFVRELGRVPEGIDMSEYEDMQEVLAAADVLITDYSSSIWDFCLTGRPGYLFAPDVEAYEAERAFYTPIEAWQYPVAKSNKELADLIEQEEDTKRNEKIQKHLELLQSYEKGEACRIVGDYICGKCL